MPVNPRGIWCGALIFPDPPDVLGAAADGRKSRVILRIGLPGLQGGDSGGPVVPQHLQRGGGCGGEALG